MKNRWLVCKVPKYLSKTTTSTWVVLDRKRLRPPTPDISAAVVSIHLTMRDAIDSIYRKA